MEMKVIAHIRSDFPTKFGIPHQSGRIQELKADIIFEPEYRNHEAFRGLEEYTHIWLIWEFSEVVRENWSPTVRPPRLGGNKRCGVFATRSPFRPNPIGLSCVRLLGIEKRPEKGMVVEVEGADLMDGTPILDIKPYLPHIDSHPEATGGFALSVSSEQLEVIFPDHLLQKIPEADRKLLSELLSQDPRDRFIHDNSRIWGLTYGNYNIRFQVHDNVLTVSEVTGL